MNDFIATYRLQFAGDFDFDQAASASFYLKELGISHLYASPVLKPVSGSMHGYDIVDFTKVNPALGGEEAFERLCGMLQVSGMGMILDIVPNHMAAHPLENPHWQDVLAIGPLSPYADFFDIDWATPDIKTYRKVLAPVLGDHYDACLSRGELQLKHRKNGIFLAYFEHELPLSTDAVERIWQISENNHAMGINGTDLVDIMERDKVPESVLADINKDPDLIHDILELCHFRLAFWRTAAGDINYRRFFDINELVGLRMEKEAVFNDAHELVLNWFDRKLIDGFRVDHPDGLYDPHGYLMKLSHRAPEALLLVEKILETDEPLPAAWPVAGTTGYDFLHRVNGLFVDPAGEIPLTRLYEELTGPVPAYAEMVRRKKHQVLDQSFQSETGRLAAMLIKIRFRHRRYRDLVYQDLRDALKEVIACFPVYRTYVRPEPGVSGPGELSDIDRQRIGQAVSRARRHLPHLDDYLFDFMENLLTLSLPGNCETEFVARFQQFTGQIMAKGMEDTAFYCFNRLISLNEVGGDPGAFGVSVEAFHRHCEYIQAHYPLTLSATATHDTKRGEDTRLRIDLLSEIPEKWAGTVKKWMRMTAGHQTRQNNEDLPDADTRYLFFQTLAGAWPIDEKRITGYMQKAIREAKVHTSWGEPDEAYEEAVLAFVRNCLSDSAFTKDLEAFVSGLIRPARMSSLSQTLLKCTAPGIPDIYQGTEMWDHSLVDPDNRRPVDFSIRRHLLATLKDKTGPDTLAEMESGLPKLFVIAAALDVRRRFPEAFGKQGSYQPLTIAGDKAKHAVGFIRGGRCITIATRLFIGLDNEWGETVVRLPGQSSWENVMTGKTGKGGDVLLASLLTEFPAALLVPCRERM
jgi:(1->4)-alpha-D-glucan 1-alpha-D-glucosylmutase